MHNSPGLISKRRNTIVELYNHLNFLSEGTIQTNTGEVFLGRRKHHPSGFLLEFDEEGIREEGAV